MAKSLVSYTTFLALLLCFLLISSNEMQAAEGKLCRRKSKTFSGYCFISEHCDEECKEKEGAKRGMCIKKSIFRRYCYCYHKCK
ncbi:defensin-like protein 1 [Nicotiana tabacum]|uniref:Defensin-like protein 1 n=2 Tax=Nicotiana TaxID=4085 RepID=A0A1S4AKU3_TOBAC|nr:PREDICTED: defensin-like protein 1 [Nicotiana sylvestris]XP_009772946.1 PREDICTED: defensin-like protein 1 [Nicotiana sylvestris]XP_016477320.1 PREDICTED: defensin-like protein 1 [Nicotiana tabacum]XP_016477322.1 PREDICTED: defensin-like protein 1 [Nicotiana tabacum]XP_019266787.1 PREDICTED: defensin-like protein 1 [Nicotiana attenuata]XP_019266788.1 PREDICTED: defensin-like protein 1 [Nicotiana attenuata]